MAFLKSWLRIGAAAAVIAGLLGLGMGCHHAGNTANSYTVSGVVNYTRIPLSYDSNGVPTGLATDPSLYKILPARGVQIRVYQSVNQVDAYGNWTPVWLLAGKAVTDIYGEYWVGSLQEFLPTFVEVDSISTTSSTVKLVGDPAGVDSLVPEAERVIYALRMGVDGIATPASTGSATPGTALNFNATVNFTLGLNDTWLLTAPGWDIPATGPFPMPATIAVGSKPLAILDSIYTFANSYGNVTPSNYLDLHYNPNVRNPRGSFVEYNRSLYPLSFDGSVYHFFGSIAGTNLVDNVTYPDDAYYEGIIFPLLGRNTLYAQNTTVLYPTGEPQTNLDPALAVIEGFPLAMAAAQLESPYLADPSNPARYPPVDITNTASLTLAQQSPFSAPSLAPVAWQMILQANGLAYPGNPASWALIDPGAITRLYELVRPTVPVGKINVVSGVNSLYTQLALLQGPQASSDLLNLELYFSDSYFSTLLAPYNMTWPGAASIPNYSTNWGKDPNTLVSQIPAFTLSMAQAQLVRGVYPNNSKGEVVHSSFTLSQDTEIALSFKTVPPLPPGATLEVTVDPAVVSAGVYLYGGANPAVNNITLRGNYRDLTNPAWHYLQIRLLSPNVLQPDIQVSVQMQVVNPDNPNVTLNTPG